MGKYLVRAFSVLVFLYGLYGLSQGDITVPAKTGRPVHFQGMSAVLIFMAMIALAIYTFLAGSKYDDKEQTPIIARVALWVFWIIFVLFISVYISKSFLK